MKLRGDHTADDRVDELVAFAALLRLDAQPRDRELPVTAALLLELALGFGRTGDRLAVRDPHVVGFDLDSELAVQLLGRDGQVCLAHAAQHGLVRLGVAFDAQHRIFFLETVQRVRELVLVGLALGVDRDREQRFGRLQHFDIEGRALRRENVAGTSVRELGDGGDVAGGHVGDGVLILAAHDEQLVEALVGLGARRSMRTSSCFTVPCSTLKRFTCPTYGSTMVLNTSAPAAPSAASGAGASSMRNFASRSTPTSFVALPHNTGNTVALAMPAASALASSDVSIGSSPR